MKKSYFLPVILLTCVFGNILFSCSKEKIITPPATHETVSTDYASVRIINDGSVTGMILPQKTEVSIVIFNDKYSTKDFYYTKDGSFWLDNIPDGIYTVSIIYVRAPKYQTTVLMRIPVETTEYLITDIKIGAGMLVDLGVIKLR